MKLSILIPSLISRAHQLNDLKKELARQAAQFVSEVEVLSYVDNGEASIGDKRNHLLQKAEGQYLCFIDDDDTISANYLNLILDGIKENPDCCSLAGVISWDGMNEEFFEHSIRYSEYKTTDKAIKYERYPNHLNVIRADIAKQFKFPSINHGEDTDWATQINRCGLLKKEFYIPDIIYHYQYKTKK